MKLSRLSFVFVLMISLTLFAACSVFQNSEKPASGENTKNASAGHTDASASEATDKPYEDAVLHFIYLGEGEGGHAAYSLGFDGSYKGLLQFDLDEEFKDLKVGGAYYFTFDGTMTRSLPPTAHGRILDVLKLEPSVLKLSFDEGLMLRSMVSDAQLVDVRTAEEFKEGHVPGALNVSLQSMQGGDFGGLAKDKPVIVYCRSGNRSATAAKILEEDAYSMVFDIGGIGDYHGDLEK